MYCATRLRCYHDSRLRVTEACLLAALGRMQAGIPERIESVEWTKQAWAQEAGVNVNTALSKRTDGTFVFSAANRLFDELKGKQQSKGKKPLQQQNSSLLQLVAQMQRKHAPTDDISI